MRVTVDGVSYGISFKHEIGPSGRLAREIVFALTPPPPERQVPLVDVERIAMVVQSVLDRHPTMPRVARRAREAMTTCTIWKGTERPWDDETRALKPGADANILISYTAECSIKDHFNRASGRKVAFYKALGPDGLNYDDETRKKWISALKLAQKELRKHSKAVAAAKVLAKAKESLASAPPPA